MVLILGMLGVMATTFEVVAVVTELEDWGADIVLGGTAEMTNVAGLIDFKDTTISFFHFAFVSLLERYKSEITRYTYLCIWYVHQDIRVFPKVDHSANIARIVSVEYTIGSVVGLNFC